METDRDRSLQSCTCLTRFPPRSPRAPVDDSALEKLADTISDLQATVAAPPKAVEERRRTYASIKADLEEMKRIRRQPDERLTAKIAGYVREIQEEKPREGLDYDEANVAEMRTELRELGGALKQVEAAVRDKGSPPRTARSGASSRSSRSSSKSSRSKATKGGDALLELSNQLASLREDLSAPAVARQHRRTSYANMKQDLAVRLSRVPVTVHAISS